MAPRKEACGAPSSPPNMAPKRTGSCGSPSTLPSDCSPTRVPLTKMREVPRPNVIATWENAPSGSGTEATWQTSYSGNYLNRENNEPFERPCEGTGALEDLIQKAVDG